MIVCGKLTRRRLARTRVRSRRTLRCVAPVAARGAAHPRGRRSRRRSCAACAVALSCANPTSASPRATPRSCLQFRNVTLADVHEARSIIEPAAARMLASARDRRAAAEELRTPDRRRSRKRSAIPRRSARRTPSSTSAWSSLAGNQTLEIVAEMLNEIVERAVTAVSQSSSANGLAGDPPPRHPFAGTPRGADRAGRGQRGGGALALAHGGRRQGHPRPARDSASSTSSTITETRPAPSSEARPGTRVRAFVGNRFAYSVSSRPLCRPAGVTSYRPAGCRPSSLGRVSSITNPARRSSCIAALAASGESPVSSAAVPGWTGKRLSAMWRSSVRAAGLRLCSTAHVAGRISCDKGSGAGRAHGTRTHACSLGTMSG